jgi:hypothetical protein
MRHMELIQVYVDMHQALIANHRVRGCFSATGHGRLGQVNGHIQELTRLPDAPICNRLFMQAAAMRHNEEGCCLSDAVRKGKLTGRGCYPLSETRVASGVLPSNLHPPTGCCMSTLSLPPTNCSQGFVTSPCRHQCSLVPLNHQASPLDYQSYRGEQPCQGMHCKLHDHDSVQHWAKAMLKAHFVALASQAVASQYYEPMVGTASLQQGLD